MSRSRMFGDEEPTNAEQPSSPRTTIVGGRPPEKGPPLPPIPTGLQTLLRLASLDDRFLQALIAQRADVASAAGVQLTPSERAILAAIPAEQLQTLAQRLPPPASDRRSFLTRAAASAVVLLGGVALGAEHVACAGGSRPDMPPHFPPPDDPPAQPPPDPRFAQPPPGEYPANTSPEPGLENPPPRPPDNDMPRPAGVRPDSIPPGPTRGIKADVPPPRPDGTGAPPSYGITPDLPPQKTQ